MNYKRVAFKMYLKEGQKEEYIKRHDILGHAKIAEAVKPIKVATGEHCQNRVIFKQLTCQITNLKE